MSAGRGDWSRLAERGTMGALRIVVFVHRRLCLRHPDQWFNFFDPPDSGAAA